MIRFAAAAAIMLALSGCGNSGAAESSAATTGAAAATQASSSSSASPSQAATTTQAVAQKTDAKTVAAAIKSKVPTVTATTVITEDNDPNNLIGRPNGYVAAVVLTDKAGECSDGPGVDCGATVEEWPDEASAKRRADYIQTLQKEAPMLGNDYLTLRGNLLLRVDGKIKPSVAKQYAAALS